MKFLPETSPFPRMLVWPLLAVGAALLAGLRGRPELFLRIAHCPLKDAWGVPCPTCGGTHAAAALARFDLSAAWGANPLVMLVAAAFAAWAAWAVAATFAPRWRVACVLNAREKTAARILAAVLVVLGWGYQFLR